MELNNIQPAAGSVRSNSRVGRGQGSGGGGTAKRGHKGAKSRSGYSRKVGFEGGQMPLQRIVPKFGFKNMNRVEYKAINLDVLQQIAEAKGVTEITPVILLEAGVISKNDKVKILGGGALTLALKVQAHAFSKTAKEAIEKLEGTTETI